MEDKETLEKQKLVEEIEFLKKPAWKKISFWSALAPIIVSIIAVFFAYENNLFDLNSKLLQIKNENLEWKNHNLNRMEDSLNSNFHRKADSLNNINGNIVKNAAEISIQYQKRELLDIAKLKSKDEIINYYKMKVDSLTNLIIKSKSIRKVLGDFNNDFNKNYLIDDRGRIITDEKGRPILTD